jgi:hypothetical protein
MSVTDVSCGGLVVFEAVKTTASTAEIWAIVVVAVVCLAFWLGVVAWADMHPIVRQRQVSDMPGPVMGGMHVGSGGRSVSPNREAPSVLTNVDDVPYDQRDYDPEDEMAAQWTRAEQGQPWVPVQREAGQMGTVRRTPAQRGGAADQAERTAAEQRGD